jgi:branched-chain amino acid transport system ATP-binding protein
MAKEDKVKAAKKKAAKAKAAPKKKAAKKGVSGYGGGSVDVVMSVDQVAKEAASIAANAPSVSELDGMVEGDAFLTIDALRAGYGKMEILHEFTLRVGRGQSLCLDRAEWSWEIHRPAFNLRLHKYFQWQHQDWRPGCHRPVAIAKAG